ncbi:zinc-ribbon domain-containing protein [Pseudonocardia broussonetiae]|uniref:Zinc-ribbon domain-containing protein n=1 Tax=Pseudonocardia broussonetiae TaxID=2736640 RepID=A0A6M6JN51_9PSEU|nr:zinc-ribbon domain-containing protein [Pseudonocardia broussonetiae]QJY47741.1 zinc-ribbon domain-containing protein [Pseudonocardia broussonetiae]
MILFFGTRVRTRVLDSQTGRCPYCGQLRTCERVALRSWFHVFWIPIFPIGRGQEAQRCTVCRGEWR